MMPSSGSTFPLDSAEAAPTSVSARLDSLDVLRGLAVLMIFVVNIKMMASGYNHYGERTLYTGPYDQGIGYFHNVFVHGKFVTIFTALFGAGLVLLLNRERPVPLPIVARRLFWLAVFGALHLVFIREGDILAKYALVGFVAIPLVNLRGSWLLLLGVGGQAALFVASIVFPVDYGEEPLLWRSDSDMHLEVQRVMLGSIADQISARLDTVEFYFVDLFLRGRGWFGTLSIMMMGMGLFKIGFLTGKLPRQTYWATAAIGAACLVPITLYTPLNWGALPNADIILNAAWTFNQFGGAAAWSALTVGLVSAGWKAKALSAAGRMAFTIYIAQSVIGLLLFSSLGLGLFGQLSLGELTIITLVTTVFFLIMSPMWLSRFRFGPLEWVWRSLTYGRRQPLLRKSVSV
ncbi:MAG: DUF418 domain-containing protein [Pseudomonadota bacterium]